MAMWESFVEPDSILLYTYGCSNRKATSRGGRRHHAEVPITLAPRWHGRSVGDNARSLPGDLSHHRHGEQRHQQAILRRNPRIQRPTEVLDGAAGQHPRQAVAISHARHLFPPSPPRATPPVRHASRQPLPVSCLVLVVIGVQPGYSCTLPKPM